MAQPVNNECWSAINIDNALDWCSQTDAFTNEGASDYLGTSGFCSNNSSHDVWFSFDAVLPYTSIVVIGRNLGSDPGGTISAPEVMLYEGTCDPTGFNLAELQCARDGGLVGITSLIGANLTVGQTYFIRVEGVNDITGTFQLCLKGFIPPADPGQDCVTSSPLCDTTSFIIEEFEGGGNVPDEAANTCIGGVGGGSEGQSTWYTWIADNSGIFTFVLDPLKDLDDLDWVLYEFPDGIGACDTKVVLRCNAAYGGDGSDNCPDETGLDLTSTDLVEDGGCANGQDGFVRYVDMVEGTAYGLLVNNWTTSGVGFEIEFGGDVEFRGPEAAFEVDPPSGLKCEIDFSIINNSVFILGNIISYEWNFGLDAIPPTFSGENPPSLNYSSFGPKFITLTVESDLGCIVTEIVEIFVEPCCEDDSDLELIIDNVNDVSCNGEDDGLIQASGNLGSGNYQYAIDDGPYLSFAYFSDLAVGTYEIKVIDGRGCLDSLNVSIGEPVPFFVDAGPDITVDLGDDVNISTTLTPPGTDVTYSWNPTDSLSCVDCPDVTLTGLVDQIYYVTVMDETGCFHTDSIMVTVEVNRPLYSPNVFSPNGDNINDNFTIYGGKEAVLIERLQVFSRWGALIYEATNIPLNDETIGWDGTVNGVPLDPGIFTFFAEILFIDGVSLIHEGDIAIIR